MSAPKRIPWSWRRLIDEDGLPPQAAETDDDCLRRVADSLEADMAVAERAEAEARAFARSVALMAGVER